MGCLGCGASMSVMAVKSWQTRPTVKCRNCRSTTPSSKPRIHPWSNSHSCYPKLPPRDSTTSSIPTQVRKVTTQSFAWCATTGPALDSQIRKPSFLVSMVITALLSVALRSAAWIICTNKAIYRFRASFTLNNRIGMPMVATYRQKNMA